MPTLNLPTAGGTIAPYTTRAPKTFPKPSAPFNRVAYAAAHVVADPLADGDPWLDAAIDWDTTIAFRRHLWSLGLGVAEAMDTAQRGMGMDWPNSLELIRRSLDAAKDFPGALIGSGAGTDHLAPSADVTIDDVIRAYEEQCAAVEKLGGRIILMASRALVKAARSPDDYAKVYARILDQVKEPVIIHWLGEMFDPALDGYWGHKDHMKAMEVAVDVIASNPAKVDGVKISLLDKDKEIAMRRRLPQGVRMYTGDDFNYAELIAGDAQGYSDALLGIFDAIAPAASAALGAFTRGDVAAFHEILAPTVPLSRHIFKAPTRFYKTGVVFMAYLNGLQNHFTMIGGQESTRSTLHLAELFRLADAAGLLADPDAGGAAHEARHGDARCALMRDLSKDRSLLAINSATVKPWTLEQLVEGCVRAGITAIAPWRDIVQAAGVEKAGNMIRAAGLTVSCYCRAGLFPAADEAGRRAALDDNRRAVDEAAAIGARSSGADRGRAAEGLEGPRRRAPAGPRRDRGAVALRARGRRAARDRAAASDVRRRPRLREHARPCQRSLRPARRRRWPRGRCLSRLVGPGPGRARSRAPASASSPITSATGWCRPAICCSTAACRATASSTCAPSAPWWRRPATTATSTSRFSPRRTGGSASRPRCCGFAWSGTRRWCDARRVRVIP